MKRSIFMRKRILACSLRSFKYRNVPKFSDRYAWANSTDPEEQSDQGLHCLPFSLHCMDSLLEPHSSNFRVTTTNILGVRVFRKFTVAHAQVLKRVRYVALCLKLPLVPYIVYANNEGSSKTVQMCRLT